VLGSVLSRAINGQAAFFPTLGAGVMLIGLHVLFSFLSSRWHWLSVLIKGRPRTLVRDGTADRSALRRSMISDDDLNESLRTNGNVTDIAEVAEARLERNGDISVVKKKR
jgi:uncharacterized membrane protein YcaP (DUF421 family)